MGAEKLQNKRTVQLWDALFWDGDSVPTIHYCLMLYHIITNSNNPYPYIIWHTWPCMHTRIHTHNIVHSVNFMCKILQSRMFCSDAILLMQSACHKPTYRYLFVLSVTFYWPTNNYEILSIDLFIGKEHIVIFHQFRNQSSPVDHMVWV